MPGCQTITVFNVRRVISSSLDLWLEGAVHGSPGWLIDLLFENGLWSCCLKYL